MFTPQGLGKGTPNWGASRSAERRMKGKSSVTEYGVVGGSSSPSLGNNLESVPGNGLPEDNGLIVPAERSEQEIWKQFKDAGALDERSLEEKDRAALLVHISTLESELYDYQYQMGLLLLESKDWEQKVEKMKSAIADVEENLKREQAANMIAITEAERREDALKRALSTEKQCVADLEKALKEMQAEHTEVKENAERHIAQAKDMLVGMEEKSVKADSRLHAGEAIFAQASRKQADAERKLQEVQAREDALRRQQQEFKVNCEARKHELDHEEDNLKEWEKRLQDGQNRLLDGERILNRREEFVNQKDLDLRKIEEDVKVARKQLEQCRSQLHQDEIESVARSTAISLREESAIKKEVALDKKEQEVLLLEERVASRECIFEQHERHIQETELFNCKERERLEALESSLKLKEDFFNDKKQGLDDLMKALDETRKEEVRTKLELQSTIDELERLRELVSVEQDDLEKKKQSCMALESEMNQKEEKLSKREQQIEKKAEKVKEQEKDADRKLKGVKEREKVLKNEEKQANADRRLIEQEKEGLVKEKEEIERWRIEILTKNQKIEEEKEKLRAVEQEREELLLVKTQLKGEIDELRAEKHEYFLAAEDLKKEKERFEKEWDLLDEKNEEARRQRESLEQESQRVSKWLQDEEERIKREKREMHDRNHREHQALQAEKEAFLNNSEMDKINLFEMVEKDRDNLARDLELHRVELEKSIEKRRDELEKEVEELKIKLNEEIRRAQEEIWASKDALQLESKEVSKERSKFDKERQEMAKQREEVEEKWLEIKKDIEELQLQREKLREQRESLRNERAEVVVEAEKLKRLRDELKEGDESLQISEQQPSHKHANDSEAISLQKGFTAVFSHTGEIEGKSLPVGVEPSPSNLAVISPSLTPGNVSWLQRCTSRLFQHSGGDKTEPNFLRGGSNGSTKMIDVPEQVLPKLTEHSPEHNDGRPAIVSIHEQKVKKQQDPIESSSHLQKIVNRVSENSHSRTRRTHSIKAVMEDAKFILQETSAGRGNEAVLAETEKSEKETDYLQVSACTLQDSGQVPSEDTGTRGRRKRAWRLSKVGGEEDGTPEVNSAISADGRKRKRQQEAAVVSSANGDSGKGSFVTKRYNLRHSTIVNTIATQATAGQEKIMTQQIEENPGKGTGSATMSSKEDMNKFQAAEYILEKEQIGKRSEITDDDEIQQSDHARSASLHENKIEALNLQESQMQSMGVLDSQTMGGFSNRDTDINVEKIVRGVEIGSDSDERSEGEAQAEQDSSSENEPTESVKDESDDVENCSEDEDGKLEDDAILKKDERPLGKKLWEFFTT